MRQPQSVRGTNISVSHGLGGRWFYCRRSGETTFRGDHLKYDKTLDTVNHCAYIIHSCGAIGHDFSVLDLAVALLKCTADTLIIV